MIKMSDQELEKIRKKKGQMRLKHQIMPKEIIIIKDEEDLKSLISNFEGKIVVIDFWAAWCGPCKNFTPIFEKLQKEYHSDFIFAKINIDENPKYTKQLGITTIPTTALMKYGQVFKKFVGSLNYQSFKQILERFKFDP